MWLCISFHDRVFVSRSAPLSTPATSLKFKSPFAAFSWIHKVLCPDAQFAQSSSGHNGESCARVSQYQSTHVCADIEVSPIVSADALTKSYNSASAELRATTPATVYPPVVLRRVLLQPAQSVSEYVSS